jgi:hypothetical protein
MVKDDEGDEATDDGSAEEESDGDGRSEVREHDGGEREQNRGCSNRVERVEGVHPAFS